VDPRLIPISGSLKGTTFALVEDEVSVGRDASNSICLNDLSVSRRHCIIKRESIQKESTKEDKFVESEVGKQREAAETIAVAGAPEIVGAEDSTKQPTIQLADRHAAKSQSNEESCHFTVTDLESYNGTFVNGVPIKEGPLAHGDQIAVGDVVLLFLLHETEAAQEAAGLSDEGSLITRSTVRLRAEDAVYLRPELVSAELRSTARVARDLNTLIKVSRTLNSTHGLEELNRELLRLIVEVIPAERGAILLIDKNQKVFTSVCGWAKTSGDDNSIRVSQTIATQVLQEGIALLSNDLFESEGLGERPSLIEARVCSVLCVPLLILKETLGVIYLDTSDPGARFDEGHLQLLTAIAAVSAAPIENAKRFEWLQAEYQRLQKEILVEHRMIGQSIPMRSVIQFIGKVAPTDSTVLIRGESGTGKELAARAIHANSARSAKSFVAINGATLSETLLESELFGHEKGAFTGAIAQKPGKLEIANGGTMFLDEVAELTPAIQAKLLRVLQEREFERVGGVKPIKVDVRFVAATNKNLEAAVGNGTFRQDLYYRLNVLSVTMPPLRDRREDIQLLASHFAKIYSEKCKRRINGISPEARALLHWYDWPGNVRELENAIERSVVLGSAEMVAAEDLPESVFEAAEPGTSLVVGYHEALKRAKQSIVIKAIEEAHGNYTEAAKQLGLHPTNLHRLIRNLDLRSKIRG
jgi:Nif-specific regulatory protein